MFMSNVARKYFSQAVSLFLSVFSDVFCPLKTDNYVIFDFKLKPIINGNANSALILKRMYQNFSG